LKPAWPKARPSSPRWWTAPPRTPPPAPTPPSP
jgi:hypothetical protein